MFDEVPSLQMNAFVRTEFPIVSYNPVHFLYGTHQCLKSRIFSDTGKKAR